MARIITVGQGFVNDGELVDPQDEAAATPDAADGAAPETARTQEADKAADVAGDAGGLIGAANAAEGPAGPDDAVARAGPEAGQ